MQLAGTAKRGAQQRQPDSRKAKLLESEQKEAELKLQLQQTLAQRDTLAMRNGLLEKLVAAQQQTPQDSGCPPTEPPAAAACRSQGTTGGDRAWWLDADTRQMLDGTLDVGDSIKFTVVSGPSQHLTRRQVENMSELEFAALWRAYVEAFADCLKDAASADPGSPTGQRLEQLVHEAWQLQAVFATRRPAVMMDRFHGAEESAAGMAGMLTTLNLRQVQQAALLDLRRVYLLNLGALSQRRRRFSQQLLQEKSASAGDGVATSAATASQLQDVLRQEHSLLVQYMLAVWRFLLTPFQAASLHLQSGWTRQPDVLRLSDAMASAAGHRTAEQLLEEGAAQVSDTQSLKSAIAALPRVLKGS